MPPHPKPCVYIPSDPDEPIVRIRTSERSLFKRCRRLWGWLSPLRLGLQVRETPDFFWFGTGFHFALEDFHGYNRYGHAGKAFLAYLEATRRTNQLPSTWKEHERLGLGMLSYYTDHWLRIREAKQTYVLDGFPQVEVNATLDLGLRDHLGRKVVYDFTLDRIVVDEDGLLWIVEYKTAKQFREYHLDVDEQVTSYTWAAGILYGRPVMGVIYVQFRKAVPVLPRILRTGEVSVDKDMPTTAALYSKLLRDMYGDLAHAPWKNVDFLNKLVAEDTEDKDRFIMRIPVERNPHQLRSLQERVYLELEDILNPDLPLYPNLRQECTWSCPLIHACTAMEDGSDYQEGLQAYVGKSQSREEEMRWRKVLPQPQEIQLPQEALLYSQETQQALQELNRKESSPEELFLQELQQ